MGCEQAAGRKVFQLGLVFAGSIALLGCGALVVGVGAGAGAFSYVEGELVRSYEAPYTDVMAVCTQVLQDLEMPITEKRSEGAQTMISAHRKDGTPVALKIKILSLDATEVSVRTGEIGYWDRDFSKQFQEFIAERLKPRS
jgi:hypothetical protein